MRRSKLLSGPLDVTILILSLDESPFELQGHFKCDTGRREPADLPERRRWCDFDPTNNRCGWQSPGEEYIALAIGRDFSDVSPLRGVIHGGAHNMLSVGVTVEELAESALAAEAMGMRMSQSQSQTQSCCPGRLQMQGRIKSRLRVERISEDRHSGAHPCARHTVRHVAVGCASSVQFLTHRTCSLYAQHSAT